MYCGSKIMLWFGMTDMLAEVSFALYGSSYDGISERRVSNNISPSDLLEIQNANGASEYSNCKSLLSLSDSSAVN